MTETKQLPILAFDTSTAAMSAAIRQGHETLGEIHSLAERNHSVHIIVHLKHLMEQCGVSGEGLGAIAVGNGPGSYTGMRIAVAAAKTLAWVWKKPLIGISSLEALAYGSIHQTNEAQALAGVHWVLPIMDARRGQVYTAGFAMTADGEWSRFADDGVRLMKDWVDTIAELLAGEAGHDPAVISICGDLTLHEAEALRLKQLCAEAGIAADVRLQPYELEGIWVAELGQQRLSAGQFDDTHTFTPNYTQLTEAEVKLKEKLAEQAKRTEEIKE
ncbi:tRNA (adenosine(37)-N6)-threonylcarbamoyltransferase complex dimerization subunit type 1 TsaB [Paenibacillus radicis (ex Gao et al. 2016)]|uniref:tRNA (Adenosine(37)-N6)-threonylcarbamoyltransferase complex dimerization subunit type 1 TsaB n=1 Tax=Paenibacillus radicis (ex Gao et al. 2016) TaxID=1737354 RepID=A0A917HKS9_9BACL|nr:tRNA (adenosine(37)-N6)-threonylcarbamoyltransferase complex dimerization subunit type 1 TsaB [Paenibacillus radicis (ex Gao et al. 2016)]GGG82368.1 tRNA (adenosine(37)-N6)-threonylcarbamoyltransferase complex dimerization subunit type 1 TsaB [Paenibacillus radicis (ex Gao et al. 2016)]